VRKSCLVRRSKVLPILHHNWNGETRVFTVYGQISTASKHRFRFVGKESRRANPSTLKRS
jgi:hypothetical protein